MYADEVQERLNRWAAWTRGNQLLPVARNVLAEMIRREAGEVPGVDLSVGYQFTFDIEATDKAIARLKLAAEACSGDQRRYLKAAKRVLMSAYLGRMGVPELAAGLDCSEYHVKSMLTYAEDFVARAIPEVEAIMKARQFGHAHYR